LAAAPSSDRDDAAPYGRSDGPGAASWSATVLSVGRQNAAAADTGPRLPPLAFAQCGGRGIIIIIIIIVVAVVGIVITGDRVGDRVRG